MSKRLLIAVFALLLGSASLHAAEEILVASQRSNSLEQFTPGGTWVRTFATTGPYAPTSIAQSPLTGEIFVTTMWTSGTQIGQLANVILRYRVNGQFDTNWDTFTVSCGDFACGTSSTLSMLFDSSGNLWVATADGEDLGEPIYIFKYLAADLTGPNPPAQPNPIVADMFRGDQMAFNKSGNICIAGFIDEDVQCFDTSTSAQTADYRTEIHASGVSPAIQPAGLAFDGDNRLYLTSVFAGQVVREVKPGGPIALLATLISPPNLLNGNLVLRGGNLYVPTYYYPPPTVSPPDAVYEVSTSGTVTKFIVGAAPPALGNDHIWGAYCVMFYSTTL